MPLMQQMLATIRQRLADRGKDRDYSSHMPERRTHRRVDARAGTRVLIIDDCERALSELSTMFATSGYVTMQAQDPERGVHMACYENPELVILDIGMPGMNGFEVLKHMRKDPLARRIPVIMMSGSRQAIEIFQRRHVDADGLLRKPFSRRAVFTRIEKLLDENMVPRRPGSRRPFSASSILRSLGQRLKRH